jgi:hypothetical protein
MAPEQPVVFSLETRASGIYHFGLGLPIRFLRILVIRHGNECCVPKMICTCPFQKVDPHDGSGSGSGSRLQPHARFHLGDR